MVLTGSDVAVAIKLVVTAPGPFRYADLSRDLGLSVGGTHQSVTRLRRAQLVRRDPASGLYVQRAALLELLVHGVRYVFVPDRGPRTRGILTAHAAPPLRGVMAPTDDVWVWPDPLGDARGEALSPLYPKAPHAARLDAAFYAALALVDAIRAGNARERKLAVELLRDRLAP